MSLIEGFEHIARQDEPLAPHTRLGIGGSAEYFAEPLVLEELTGLVRRFSDTKQPVRLLGSGTNLVVSDRGVKGLVIRLNAPAFCELKVDGNQITVGGGTQLAHFVATAAREGLAGPEQLVGIPGTIGGALHLNVGTHAESIGNWIRGARVLTRAGEIIERDQDSLSFSYRESSLNELAILNATFEFDRESPETLTRRMQKLWIVRRAQQPVSQSRSIYVFKDPVGESAAELIERSGLTGFQSGHVGISETDGNIFVAEEGATAEEMLKLIEMARQRVFETTGIELKLGVDIW